MERYNNTSSAYDLSRFQRPQPQEQFVPTTKARVNTTGNKQVGQNDVKVKQGKASPTLAAALDNIRGMDRSVARSRRGKIVKFMAVCATFVFMLGSVVYSQANLNEANRQITRTNKSIATMQSEYSQKSVELEQRVNLKTAEEVATNQMGMTKISSTQVEYISLGQQDSVANINKKQGLGGVFQKINTFVENLLAYIKG